jgi:hypothetical protein
MRLKFKTIAALFTLAAKLAAAASLPLPSDVELSLPAGLEMPVSWVISQSGEGNLKKIPGKTEALLHGCDLDPLGNPWFGLKGRLIACPSQNGLFAVSVPFNNFVFLQDGTMAVCTPKALGGLKMKSRMFGATKDKFPVLAFIPRVKHHFFGAELFAGDGNALFLQAKDPKKGRFAIYGFNGAGAKKGVSRILNLEEKALAVCGDATQIFLSQGGLILRAPRPSGKLAPAFEIPGQEVTNLCYSAKSGLFYATRSEVGYLDGSRRIRLLKAADCRIRVWKDSLYVLLGSHMTVLKLSGIKGLKGNLN